MPRSPSVTASRHRLPPRQWQCCGHGATLQATVYTAVQYSLSDYGKILIDQDLSCQLWDFCRGDVVDSTRKGDYFANVIRGGNRQPSSDGGGRTGASPGWP